MYQLCVPLCKMSNHNLFKETFYVQICIYIYIYALRLEGLINVNEHLTGEIHKSEVLGNTLLGIKAYNMYQSLTKTHKTKQNSAIKELLAAFLLTIKMCIGFTADFI